MLVNGRQLDGSKLRRLVLAKGRPEAACVAADISMSALRDLYKGEFPEKRDGAELLTALANYLGLDSFAELLAPVDGRRTA